MAINTAGQTLTQNTASDAVTHVAAGRDEFDATAIVAADFVKIKTGFKPKYVQVCNVTSRIAIEFWEGMAANTCIKAAAVGTRTIETTGLTMRDDGFEISQNATLAIILASQTLQWQALG
ncbi:MAG: hypothetical protein ACRD98_00415 [Nitrososphaera sp.]